MRKFLYASSMIFIIAGTSIITGCSTSGPTHESPPPMNPECRSVMEHMHASHEQIEQLVRKNKPTAIGNIVIADHEFLQDYPQCKPPYPMPHMQDTADNVPPPPPGFPPMNPECKPVMEHMHASHEQIEQLVEEDKPTQIGKIIIANHKFLQKHPQCKPHHPMPPMPGSACIQK